MNKKSTHRTLTVSQAARCNNATDATSGFETSTKTNFQAGEQVHGDVLLESKMGFRQLGVFAGAFDPYQEQRVVPRMRECFQFDSPSRIL